jgi:hypothetical protein
MSPWQALNANQRKTMKWIAGLGNDMAVSPAALFWLVENGYLEANPENDRGLVLTAKGKAAWDARPQREKT